MAFLLLKLLISRADILAILANETFSPFR